MPSLTRVTQGTISQLTTQGLQQALSRVQTTQERLATGKQISRPSDDPGGAVAALNYRADIRRTDQYTRNAENGLDRPGTADSPPPNTMTHVRPAPAPPLRGANPP